MAEVVYFDCLADLYGDAFTSCCGDSPNVQVALHDLTGLDGSEGYRAAFVAGSNGDRTWRMSHRESISSRAVEAGSKLANENEIGSRCIRRDVESSGIRARRVPQHCAGWTPDPNPRAKIVIVRNLAHMHSDAVAECRAEGPDV
jgi:hypothetical protein